MSDKIELIRKIICNNGNNNLKIVVLDRAWIYIGYLERNDDDYTLTKASCIRLWGTTKGLGQLALEGKTKDTILDSAGTIHFTVHSLINIIDCDQSKWRDYNG